jgi:hypothetical protein
MKPNNDSIIIKVWGDIIRYSLIEVTQLNYLFIVCYVGERQKAEGRRQKVFKEKKERQRLASPRFSARTFRIL